MTDHTIRPPWAKRQFRFGHPAWMLMDFVERLQGTIDRIGPLVHRIDEAAAHRIHEGTWSIAQNIGHLGDVEDLWQERLEDLRRRRDVYTPADPVRFQKTAERHSGRPLGEIIAEFNQKRKALIGAMSGASEELQSADAFHERLQCRMRLVDCAQFYAEHDDHHLLRIRQLVGIFSRRRDETIGKDAER
ncbi:MAG: DinB family protein [Ignavibacteria bacterium]|nr:DinB family protein [Ignavibacteria bacterium]